MRELLIFMVDVILWLFQGVVAIVSGIVNLIARGADRSYVWIYRLRRRIKGEPLIQDHDFEYGVVPPEIDEEIDE